MAWTGSKIWRDMKVRKYCSEGRGSIRRVKFSTDVDGNSGAEVRGTGSSGVSKSLVRLRNIRATNSGLWRI